MNPSRIDNAIGNPFRLACALENLTFALFYDRPPEVQYPGDSRLAEVLSTREEQLERELAARRESGISDIEYGEFVPPQPWSSKDDEILSELKKVRSLRNRERSRILRLWKKHYGPPPRKFDQKAFHHDVLQAVALVRENIASCLQIMLPAVKLSPADKRAIVREALCCAGYSPQSFDIDVSGLARLVNVLPNTDDDSSDNNELVDELLECIDQGGPASDSIVQAISDRNDATRLCMEIAVGGSSAYENHDIEILLNDVGAIKRLLARVFPQTLNVQMTPEQQDLYGILYGLVGRWHGTTDQDDKELSSVEILRLDEKYPRSEALADSVRDLPSLPFTLAGIQDVYELDKHEIVVSYKNGLHKSATIMSGAVLELMLKEYLHRKWQPVQALLCDSPERILVGNPPPWFRASDIRTWSLDPLIRAATAIVQDDKLGERWVDLQRARNSVHGRGISRSTAAFSLATLVLTAELLFSAP